ncbi:MAG: UDP-N-acetylmuramoyl-L-alanine--D-glutamate ligase [Planctomycetota bacterium]|nr:UDP-N-acetylmuramoyl-L-alanine--D-glutamate ligase [Planctomycetota bacterium]
MRAPDLVGRPPAASIDTFTGGHVLVLGLGRFGGGVETARFLAAEGATCRIADAQPREALAEPAAEAEALGAEVVFGPQGTELLDGMTAVIVSPAIPADHPVVAAAFERGIPVTTEMNVVLQRCPAPVFGVTGTKGKSTTSTLLAHMLGAAGHAVHLGGNIGRPLIGALPDMRPDDRVVLEMSSFQLWWTRQVRRSPHVTVVTNLFEDHLDRHGTMAAYADAKRAALEYQTPDDVAVLPADDPGVREAGYPQAGDARRITFGVGGDAVLDHGTVRVGAHTVDLAGMRLLGGHNAQNALAAATAALVDPTTTAAAVRAGALATDPLPHRMEPVEEVDGVLYVDDSNATNPKSTLCALAAFERPVVLLLGGKDKGVDPTELVDGVVAHAKAVVGIGTTGPDLVRRIGLRAPTAIRTNMEEAVAVARELAAPGDVVLLSPGYSSLDDYPSFVARGEAFRAAVLGAMHL